MLLAFWFLTKIRGCSISNLENRGGVGQVDSRFSGRGKGIRPKGPYKRHSAQGPWLSGDTVGQLTSQGLVSLQGEWTGLQSRVTSNHGVLLLLGTFSPIQTSSGPDSTMRSLDLLMELLARKLTCRLPREAPSSPGPPSLLRCLHSTSYHTVFWSHIMSVCLTNII